MKRQFLMKLIAVSISIFSISSFNVTSAYADNYYSSQLYYGTNGTWKNVNGLWYFYDYNNNMKTGWILDKGSYYFLNDKGIMQKGVVQINGKVYLFNENGDMQMGPAVINSVLYEFDAQGALIGDKYPTIQSAFSTFGESVVSSTPEQIITGESSTPDDPSEVNPEINKSTKYTVEFRNEDDDTIKSQNVYKGEKIVLYKPIKEGYDFDSWSTKSDGEGKTYDALSNFTVEDDTVLYANWTEIESDDDNDSNESKSGVLASAITITSNKNIHEITEDGGSLQLTAEVVPEKTSNKSVTWSIENGEDIASISSDGLLSAKNNGDVTVVAKANDGSGTIGRTVIKVNGQGVNEEKNDNKDNMTPEKPVSSIEITSEPRLSYDYNEKIDLSGLKVKIHYLDGTITDEISYADFSKYAIYVKNYKNGQELEKSYVSRNKYLAISCGDKVINSQDLNMKVINSPNVITNENTFDKHAPNDCVFKYTDGTIENSVKNVVITKDGTAIDSNNFTVDYDTKEIVIKKDYINSNPTGILSLYITLNDGNNAKLSSKVCSIEIKDSEVREAPTNFIKLQSGSKNKFTRFTVLNKNSEEITAINANYDPNELEYCITNQDLSSLESVNVTWNNYVSSFEQEVTEGSYINIRKKAAKNSKPSRIASKKITEDSIAKISYINSIKSFKLKDSEGNIYDSVIDGSNITVIANNSAGMDKKAEVRSLTPLIEYYGTTDDATKVRTNIDNVELQRSEVQDTSNLSLVSYKTSTNYEWADKTPVECKVTAEDGNSRIYNIELYTVKPQGLQIISPKTFYENEITNIPKKNSDGTNVTDKHGDVVMETIVKRVDINYSDLYPSAGIVVNLGVPGIAEIAVKDDVLNTTQCENMNKIKKYTDLKDYNTNGNANVGLVFKDIPENAKKIRIAQSLEGINRSEEIIDLTKNNVYVQNGVYIHYEEVASQVPSTDGVTWQYIHHGIRSNYDEDNSKYFYQYLDSNNKVIGYSKLFIKVHAL